MYGSSLSAARVVAAMASFSTLLSLWLLVGAAVAQLSPDCARQVDVVRRGVRRLEPSAVAMADAWAKPAPGLLSGNTRLLGDMDECVAAGGRLCVADLVPTAAGGGGGESPEERLLNIATAHRAHLETASRQATFLMVRFSQWQWAACVPAACNASDARQMVLMALRPRLHPRVHLSVSVDEQNCSDGAPLPWDPPAAVALSCMVALLAVSMAASIALEIRRKRHRDKMTEAAPESRVPAWTSLSVQSGWRQLWSLQAPAGSVGCLEGVRVFSMLWLIALHKMIVWAQQPAANKAAAIQFAEDVTTMPIVNAISAVDTFLLISGFLRCRNILKELEEARFSYWRSLLQRIVRLVPAYMAVVVLYATLLGRTGSGPLWQQTIGPQVDWCRRNWYLNLLFVNNYIRTEEICVAQSWYLSVDMQLFVAAPLLVWPLQRWRRAGPVLLTSLLVLSVALPGASTLLLCHCPALIGLSTSDEVALRFARYVYFPTHNRMAPYLVGIGLAYIIHRGYFTKITKAVSLVCWSVSLVTLAAVVVGPWRMFTAGYSYSAALPAAVAYAGLHAAVWAVATAWIIFACHTRRAGWVGRLLECGAARPWSRLSYAVYLTHLAVLTIQQGSMRVPPAVNMAAFLHGLAGDVAASVLASLALYLLVEAPCQGLGRTLLRRLGGRRAATAPRPRPPTQTQPHTCDTAA